MKNIIVEKIKIKEMPVSFAFELLSHMKGGPSIKVLLDIALGNNTSLAQKASKILMSQVILYESDIKQVKVAFNQGNTIAKKIITSYANAEFFSNLPNIKEEIKVVTYIAGEGDISTDLLSPGNQAHSRADRELHGKCMISEKAQFEIKKLKKLHPDKRIMLISEKGTMGVGSSRMSGINNVALLIGKKISPYIPFVNNAPIVAGTNGISPIFLTTVSVTGGIGINLKNWSKKLDSKGNIILNNDDSPILKQNYSVQTGTVLIINTKEKALFNENSSKKLVDLSESFTPQKIEFMKAGGSYAVVFGKKLQSTACKILKVPLKNIFAPSKKFIITEQGLTAVEKYLIKTHWIKKMIVYCMQVQM